MKDIKLDGHVHTLECGHAYSTITENARAAKEKGLEMICWTEHGPKTFQGPSTTFFRNMSVIPPEIEGVRVLKGIEANILDQEGKIDANPGFIDKMEVVSASLHSGVLSKEMKDLDDYTEVLINVMKNPKVDYLNHLGNPKFPIDQERVIQEAKKQDKLIEINNSSFYVREGSKDNCIRIAELCKEYDVPLILGSDAHFSSSVGDFEYAKKAIEKAQVPDELIINYQPEKLLEYLKAKGKPIGKSRRDDGSNLVF